MLRVIVSLTTTALLAGCGAQTTPGVRTGDDGPERRTTRSASYAAASVAPLAGVTVVLDPGHQLGNRNFPRQINRLVDARGFLKPCNSVGTSTNGGFPESTFAFGVARRVRDRLVGLGARVVMTRSTNRTDRWGPCVDYRGKLGNAGFAGRTRDATLKLSIHGDGSSSRHRGFHLIIATKRGQKAASTRYAKATRAALQSAGFPRSSYIGGGTALDHRGDLATLNWSHVPTFMAELGNMRNARDSAAMTSPDGRGRYARALVRGMRTFLGR